MRNNLNKKKNDDNGLKLTEQRKQPIGPNWNKKCIMVGIPLPSMPPHKYKRKDRITTTNEIIDADNKCPWNKRFTVPQSIIIRIVY